MLSLRGYRDFRVTFSSVLSPKSYRAQPEQMKLPLFGGSAPLSHSRATSTTLPLLTSHREHPPPVPLPSPLGSSGQPPPRQAQQRPWQLECKGHSGKELPSKGTLPSKVIKNRNSFTAYSGETPKQPHRRGSVPLANLPGFKFKFQVVCDNQRNKENILSSAWRPNIINIFKRGTRYLLPPHQGFKEFLNKRNNNSRGKTELEGLPWSYHTPPPEYPPGNSRTAPFFTLLEVTRPAARKNQAPTMLHHPLLPFYSGWEGARRDPQGLTALGSSRKEPGLVLAN